MSRSILSSGSSQDEPEQERRHQILNCYLGEGQHHGMLGDTFVRDTLDEIAVLAREWLPEHPPAPVPPDVIVTALRAAEAATGGPTRDLWGFAAMNADAASWIAYSPDEDTARQLWTTVLDYCRRAVAEAERSERP